LGKEWGHVLSILATVSVCKIQWAEELNRMWSGKM
jgi:hypothetical protein